MFGNDFRILLDLSKEEMINEKVSERLIELILLSRKGKLNVRPGYDGVYGVIQEPEKQKKLF